MVTLTWTSSSARADEDPGADAVVHEAEWAPPTERYAWPTGRDVDIDGMAYRCFNVAQGRTLAHIYADYLDLWSAAVRWERERATYALEISALGDRLAIHMEMRAVMEADRDWYRDGMHATRAALEDAERAERWRLGLPWGLAVAEAVILAVVGAWGSFGR